MAHYHYNDPDHLSAGQMPPNFPMAEPNIPGFQTGGHPGPHYYGAPQGNGTTHPTYAGPGPQPPMPPPMPPPVQPGMPMGHNTSYGQASQQPPNHLNPRFEYDPVGPVPPAGFAPGPGPVPQRSTRPMNASRPLPQNSAGAHNVWGGSYSPQSANESYHPYNNSGPVRQQNPPPIPPRPQPQGTDGWNLIGGAGPYSHSSQSANGSYSSHPSAGFSRQQNLRPINAASPHQGSPDVQPRPQLQGTRDWNLIGGAGSYSHSGQSANGSSSYSSHPPAGFSRQQNPRPMNAASSHQGPPDVQHALGPYPRRTDRTIAKKRKAIVIGIDYSQHPDPRWKLKCCIGDAHHMANFLCDNLHFAESDVRLMTDEPTTPLWNYPTKENILVAMRELVRDAQPHDSFFVYFSGHGVQIDDLNGDEHDGLDECICAADYLGNPYQNANTPGLIVDDIMHEILVKSLPLECHLTAVFDSCHSGTVLDLPHIYRSDGVVKKFNHPYRLEVLREKESRAVVISLSASKDNQKARETHLGGALRGAFIDSMRMSNNILTYKELIQNVREYMRRNRLRQRPQLSSSHEIDTNLRFIV